MHCIGCKQVHTTAAARKSLLTNLLWLEFHVLTRRLAIPLFSHELQPRTPYSYAYQYVKSRDESGSFGRKLDVSRKFSRIRIPITSMLVLPEALVNSIIL